MAKLTGKLGEWTVPHVHMWKDRGVDIRAPKIPLLKPGTKIATIGSCFASELASAMTRLGLDGEMHPSGLFYNTRSIRQEIDRIFGGWPEYKTEPLWKVESGWVHPFKDGKVFASEEEARAHSEKIDRAAEQLFKNAEVIVMTLGLIESWRNPKTGNMFFHIPHPDVFEELKPEFKRLTTTEMRQDLETVLAILRKNTNAEIIFTVSPVPLHATMTPLDVRVANTESKARIRAVASEFAEAHPDVHYFHSYEIVTTAERLSDFMMEDGRHVHRHAVDYILQQFIKQFGGPGLAVPEIDTSWLSGPSKTAERPSPTLKRRIERIVDGVRRRAGVAE